MDPSIPEPPGSPRLLRARGVGEILVDAFTLYRMHWRNLLAIVAVVVVPLTLLQVILVEAFVQQVEIERRLPDGSIEVSGGDLATALFGGFIVAVISIVAWMVLTGAITRAAAGTFLARDLRVDETYRYALSRLGSILLVAILVGLAVAGGFLLLVVPGFIVLTRLSTAVPALVLEDRRGRDALRRSWDLVKGFSWPVFGAIIVSALLTGLFSSLLTAPFGENEVGYAIGQTIAAVLTTPYTALVGILIYFSLRVRKEGYGIADLEQDLARTDVS
jgi:hypothetical protein